MWLKHERFKELMWGWWQGCEVEGSMSCILTQKLKLLKRFLKDWDKTVFGNLAVNKAEALRQVAFWDAEESSIPLTADETERKLEAKTNMRFFHKMANAHRRRNQLSRIRINGVWCTERIPSTHKSPGSTCR